MRAAARFMVAVMVLEAILLAAPSVDAHHTGSSVTVVRTGTGCATATPPTCISIIPGYGAGAYTTDDSYDGSSSTYSTVQSNFARSGDSTCSNLGNGVKWSVAFHATAGGTDVVGRAVQQISIDAVNTGGGGGYGACVRVHGIRVDGTDIDMGQMGQWSIGNPATRSTFTLSGLDGLDYKQLDFFMIQKQGSPSGNFGLTIYEITVVGIPNIPPAVPAGVTATAQGCTLNVAWTPSSDTFITGWYVYRATSATGTYSLVATVAGSGASGWTDAAMLTDDHYWYKVAAYSPDGASAQSVAADGVAAICDGTGLGSVGADSHMGPNELTHKAVTASYTSQGQWSLSTSGGYTVGCVQTYTFGELPLVCATDGDPNSYLNFNSISTYTRDTNCWTTGYVTWDFHETRSLQNNYVRARTYSNSGAAHSGCIKVAYIQGDGVISGIQTWTGLSAGTTNDLWYNLSTPISADKVRIYFGDTNCGGTTTCGGGALIYEADIYNANATIYDPTSSLRDLVARYSEMMSNPNGQNLGDYTTRAFQIYGGTWKVVMPVPYDTISHTYTGWVLNAAGGGWSYTRDSVGPRIPSWTDPQSGKDCAVEILTITNTGGSKSFTASAAGTNTGTTFCRITGDSYLPGPYQPASQGYKITGDFSNVKRACGNAQVSCGSAELIGMVYQATGFPWSPMIDGDFTASNFNANNFTIGSVLMGSGAIGTHGALSLAKYPYQFFGNGIFIALAQEKTTSQYDSTQWEITINGRPAAVVYNGALSNIQYAIFYVDDQATRRDVPNHDGVHMQGNRREHGFLPETYEFELLKGFSPDKPVRVMRTFGIEGHSGLTCRDFCSANVDFNFYKPPWENANKLTWTVTDSAGAKLSGVRVTDNRTGAFYFTNGNGQVILTDYYKDTTFTFGYQGFYSKCVGFAYQSLAGQQISTISSPCASSESYPKIRAQNLAYTVILYEQSKPQQSSTEFNEVPVDLVDKPTQGIVFRSSNLSRLIPDQTTIQIQRNISEDLTVTVMRFNPHDGTLTAVTTPYQWARASVANPLLIVYPAGRETTIDDVGSYHLMVSRGRDYVTGVSFRIAGDWAQMSTIPVISDPDGSGQGNISAGNVDQTTSASHETQNDQALQDAAASIDQHGLAANAAIFLPLIIAIFLAALIVANRW